MNKTLLSTLIASVVATGMLGCNDHTNHEHTTEAHTVQEHTESAVNAVENTAATVVEKVESNTSVPAVHNHTLTRVVAAPLKAEFTGLFLTGDGKLFLNVQHPSDDNTQADADGKVFNKGTVGMIAMADKHLATGTALTELPVPSTAQEQQLVTSSIGTYKVIAQQDDDTIQGTKIGVIKDMMGNEIKSSNDPDFNALVPAGVAGTHYLYTNWEDRPGGMSRIKLSGYDAANGYANITKEGMLDFSGVNGTWVNCFGTLSPWGTPLTSEELYFDDTADWYDNTAKYFSNPAAVSMYRGFIKKDETPTDATQWANPYDYGYITEVGVKNTVAAANIADVKVNKLELLGRFSHENAVVLPDNRSVLLSDDGTGTVLFKFVADAANNMSSGTLYAAKVTQMGGKDPHAAKFGIQWIDIGSGKESDIEAAIRTFDGTYGEKKQIIEEQITAYAHAKMGKEGATNPFADDRVAFFESRKAAKALGATAEFRKMEGVNINYNAAKAALNAGQDAYAYLAMSSFDKTMSDGEGDIDLDGTNGKCGVVYRMKLLKNSAGLVDVDTMEPVVVGGPYNGDDAENKCSTAGISNPDNLLVLADGRVLIGEDTGNHKNNMIWVYNPNAK